MEREHETHPAEVTDEQLEDRIAEIESTLFDGAGFDSPTPCDMCGCRPGVHDAGFGTICEICLDTL